MNEAPAPEGLPPSLRFLWALVILLMITMIGGVITVVGLLVTRMPDAASFQAVALPERLSLPPGAAPLAVTQGPDWVGVMTTDGRLFVFAPDGTLRREVAIGALGGDGP